MSALIVSSRSDGRFTTTAKVGKRPEAVIAESLAVEAIPDQHTKPAEPSDHAAKCEPNDHCLAYFVLSVHEE